jgi:AraC-like DNA-binding protein
MSYDQNLLFKTISLALHRSPRTSLSELSGQLRVSRRTVQHVIIRVTGRKFMELRDGILRARVKDLYLSGSPMSIKELSFSLGYKSARSFARAIRRACGLSPEELRITFAKEESVLQRPSFESSSR